MSEITVDLTIIDIAKIIGVTRGTIYNKQRSGELPDGSGIYVVRVYLENEERRLADIRRRLSDKVAKRLVIGA